MSKLEGYKCHNKSNFTLFCLNTCQFSVRRIFKLMKISKHKFLIIKRDIIHQITSNAIIFIGCKLCIKPGNIRSEVEKSLMPITWWWVLQPEVTEIFRSEFIFLSKKLIRICFLIYSRLKSNFGRPESFLL